ncbi:glycosyltransferase family 2 protein [Psychroserpens mesophilus]|uniref:glycosyltransferase family 2 protein n=1 Tax=Psychroserpens mesophilus TaxID=325473 RepID=UPI003D658C98
MNPESIEVSVVIPIYNGEKTLKVTLESLAKQTFQNFEVIACIDGTFDGSEALINAFESKFKQLTLLKNPINRGLGPTMNRLVFASQGDFIAIAEQDDYYYPNRLQTQVEILKSRIDVGMVSGIAEFYDGENITKFPGLLINGEQYPEGEDMFLLNYRKQIKVVNSCLMFRKQVHVSNGLYFSQHYPSVSVDWSYILRFSLVSKIYGMHEVLVRIDRTANRNSVTSNKKKQFNAANELIRSFYYEFPNIVKKEDYFYAKQTQKLLELSNSYGIVFYVKAIMMSLWYWNDKRFIKKLFYRLRKKIKK